MFDLVSGHGICMFYNFRVSLGQSHLQRVNSRQVETVKYMEHHAKVMEIMKHYRELIHHTVQAIMQCQVKMCSLRDLVNLNANFT